MWAIRAKLLIPRAKLMACGVRCGSHAFVKIGKLYYDAECTGGTCHWGNLPFFKRENGRKKPYSPTPAELLPWSLGGAWRDLKRVRLTVKAVREMGA